VLFGVDAQVIIVVVVVVVVVCNLSRNRASDTLKWTLRGSCGHGFEIV